MKTLPTKIKLRASVEAVNAAVMEQVKHQVKAMMLYRHDLEHDDGESPFSKLVNGDDHGKGKKAINSSAQLVQTIVRTANAFVLDSLFEASEKRTMPADAFSFASPVMIERAGKELASAVRLRKGKNSVHISLPMGNVNLSFHKLKELMLSIGNGQVITANGITNKMGMRCLNFFGPQFFDLSQGTDISYPVAEVVQFARPNFAWNNESHPVLASVRETILETVKSVRFTSPQIPESDWPTYFLEEGAARATRVGKLEEVPDNQADRDDFMRKVMETRLGKVLAMVNIDMDKETAQFVSQTNWDKLSLQYVNAFVQTSLEYELGSARDWAQYMTPLSSIKEFNKTSRYNGKKKTNEAGLTVTRRGDILYLPDIDNIYFVEAQIDDECKLDNGEWSLFDVVNPETSNYQIKTGERDGITRRYKKQKGANRVVYTDWKNSKFSYTDGSGALRILELSANRPVDATHLVTKTQQVIGDSEVGKAILNSISAAFKIGVLSPPTEEELRQIFPSTGAFRVENVMRRLRDQAWGGLLSDIWEQCTNLLAGTPMGDARTGDLSYWLRENWVGGVRLGEISVNCPLQPYRFIARTMKALYDFAMSDIDKFTEGRSVIVALGEIGIASIINTYGGKGRAVVEQDRAIREKYIAPDLDPVKEVQMEGIPWVKDLKVLPHQVKVWNYLKNMPELAVIDVAAGGGKTFLALLDAAKLMGSGTVKKPLIMMPNNLIKNYCNDANVIFKGRMNTVVLNGETMAAWGQERLTKLVDAAPINTIFLSSYDFFKAGKDNVSYGTVPQEISANADFMKQFEWDAVWMDESHKLKNEGAQTTQAVLEIVADIKYKRQLTGTYLPDGLIDAVGQFAAMNPVVFGTREDFLEKFTEDNNGRSAPIPNAGKVLNKIMSENCNLITIRRAEWRALLPEALEEFHPVELSVNQNNVYQSILKETVALLEEMIANDPKLQALMQEQDGNEEVQEALNSVLNPYLQRLEKFLSSPTEDEAGAMLADEDDRKSPKVLKAYEIMRYHLKHEIPGKILVFTQYKSTARALYDNAPPDLKSKMVPYTAEGKVQDMQEFQSNPSKMIMMGVETSMNTGLNLQFCSRLIRMETVWNWGNLEQGEARIMRPNMKVEEFRENIHFDWIFCNRTVDVTKTSRMIAKLVSVAKFYEKDDPNFQNIKALEMVRMTLDTIQEQNEWNQDGKGGLTDYLSAYQEYRRAETSSFNAFKANPLNRTESFVIQDGGILPGSAMLTHVPYIADMELFGMDELNLVKYSSYVNEKAPTGTKNAIDTFDPTNLKIHTEDGDGVCSGAGTTTVKVKQPDGSIVKQTVQTGSIWVQLNDGKKRSYAKTNVFVIGKKVTNAKSIREAMSKLAGAVPDELVDLGPTQAPVIPVVTPKGKKLKPVDPNAVKPECILNLLAYNEMLCVGIDEDDSPEVDFADLTNRGFIKMRTYWYAEIRSWKVLQKWIEKAEDKFYIDPKLLDGLKHTLEKWQNSRNNLHLMQQLNPSKLRDFMRKKQNPVVKGEIKPYIMVEDEAVVLCLDARANGAMVSKVRSLSVPGVRWDDANADMHYKFMHSRGEAKDFVKELQTLYTITNLGQFAKELNTIRVITGAPK